MFAIGGALGALLLPLAMSTPPEVAPVASASASAASAPPSPSVAPDAMAASAPTSDAGPAPPPVWRIAKLGADPAIEIVDGTIGKRALLAALLAAGISKNESFRIAKSLEGVRSLDRTRPKDSFRVAREKATGRVVAFELASSPFEVWQARAAGEGATGAPSDGVLAAKKLELFVERARLAVAVAVGDDLRESITKAGLDDDMLKMLDDALEGHAELTDLRPGARLRILATEERVEGEFARYAELDAVEYFPRSPSAPPLRVYWYGKDARLGSARKPTGGYYDAKGRQPFHGGWRAPVPFARVSSRFNPNRMHPVLHVVMPHTGVDFAAVSGTPVYATAAGVVTSAGDSGACGNMVAIRHGNGLVSGYCHLSRFAPGLHPGQRVEARQLVGFVGQTGRVTGPHLHFHVKRGDTFIDPLSLRLDGVRVLPHGERDEFAKRREELDAALEAIALPASSAPSHGDTRDGGGDDGGVVGETEAFFEEPP